MNSLVNPVIDEFVNVLLSVSSRVYHDDANQEAGEYIVWFETSERGLKADNGNAEESIRIAVDVYTNKEFSDIPTKLKKAFNENDIAYEYFVRDYNEDLKYCKYSTTCEVT